MFKIAAKYFGALILSIIICVIMASVFSTQRVISGLIDIGGVVSFTERMSMTLYDLTHFGSLFGIFVTLAFLIAFIAGRLVYGVAKTSREMMIFI